MAIFTDQLMSEVRLERMRPDQIDATKARRTAIYLPFGALEWHGVHNPVGLDALKAHEQLTDGTTGHHDCGLPGTGRN